MSPTPRLAGALTTVLALACCLGRAVTPASASGAPPDSAADAHAHAPQIHAAHLDGALKIDGALTEAAWAAATPETTFTQLDPHEGKLASERTEVRVLIDDDALYVGARLYDRNPRLLQARLARRDNSTSSDEFVVSIDAFHDHLTARRFRVTPAGAVLDGVIGQDGNEDDSWDGVWEARARIDSLGWSCEFRIPLSQLHYHRVPDPVWGIQFSRSIFRTGEYDVFAFTPKKEQGGVSRYGHLVGLGALPAPRRLQLVPYVAARNEHLHVAPEDPFRTNDDWFGNAGLDAKYGLTSDLTLDLTVNPDFGQVEVDPAVVNLTAFETFFPEHRSFFVEGSDLFAFGRSRAFNNFSVPTIFHSRRIGRAPQLTLGGPNHAYVDAPDQTTIAGAAKVTGRTGHWAIGALDAVTTLEQARYVDTLGVQRTAPVEPLTQYFAGRVQRDFRNGNTTVGALFTATNRKLDDPTLHALLRSSAYLGGIDFGHAWAQRRWAIDGDVTAATVNGSVPAMTLTQRSSSRYLQRPDHGSYFTYDPTRTSLAGYGGDLSISKNSGEHWLGSLAVVSRSPGYEANDLGFQTRADYSGLSSIVLFQQNKPGHWFRNYTAFPYFNEMWNYDGDRVFDSYAYDVNGQFANYWTFDHRVTYNRSVYDDRLTRGGPQAATPPAGSASASIGSDTRRPWSVSADYTYSWNEFGGWGHAPDLALSVRPSPTLRLRFEPQFSATHALAQFVRPVVDAAATSTYGTRYVFATLDQRQISLVTRLDWTFTPRLSMQLYVQPLVVTGAYTDFKEYRERRTFQFDVYGRQRGSVTPIDGGYVIDPGTGNTFVIPNPDFNFRSLLGNAVLRWEYRPGSTLYFVWQQTRTDEQPFGDFEFSRDYDALVHTAPENVFLIKATYWLGI